MYSIPFVGTLVENLNSVGIEDTTDSMVSVLSALIFLFFGIFVSTSNYVGAPMRCWVPQTYSVPWVDFAESYCFLKDKYFFPPDEDLGQLPEDYKRAHALLYYQWTGMFFLSSVAFCIFPKIIWKRSACLTNMPIQHFTEKTDGIKDLKRTDRVEFIEDMAKLLRIKIVLHKLRNSIITCSEVYCVVKMVYSLIPVALFIATTYFIGQNNDWLWGMTMLNAIRKGISWRQTGYFPRTAFCEFDLREMAGNKRNEMVECVLPVNEFNEKIFIFLWFYLILIALLVFCSNVLKAMCFKNHLGTSDYILLFGNIITDRAEIREFEEKFLTTDGLLILHFVKRQSEIVFMELLIELFENFRKNPKMQQYLPLQDPGNEEESNC